MSKYNDEPAFPVTFDQPRNSCSGMTLLDYFAGQVLNGLWAATPYVPESMVPEFAKTSYDSAEAMLEERERRMKEARNA